MDLSKKYSKQESGDKEDKSDKKQKIFKFTMQSITRFFTKRFARDSKWR